MSPALRRIVGLCAVTAPALHIVSDAMEAWQQGFSAPQLGINLLAFLPMPFLLLGLHGATAPRDDRVGLLGSLLYGAAFAYFTYTTIVALREGVPTYAELWARLGGVYTFFGGVMVVGGLLFAASALRARVLPRGPVLLFLAGLLANLALALVPVPDILQTLGSAVRNLGLMGMGHALLLGRTAR